jgi:hypothetical protein
MALREGVVGCWCWFQRVSELEGVVVVIKEKEKKKKTDCHLTGHFCLQDSPENPPKTFSFFVSRFLKDSPENPASFSRIL